MPEDDEALAGRGATGAALAGAAAGWATAAAAPGIRSGCLQLGHLTALPASSSLAAKLFPHWQVTLIGIASAAREEGNHSTYFARPGARTQSSGQVPPAGTGSRSVPAFGRKALILKRLRPHAPREINVMQ